VSRAVLIADNHRERARRLADACRAHGLEPHTVGHGTRALEVALQQPPAVLVAPFDLPLIDAVKLASILRSNPKTQQVRFVFLDDLEGGPRTSDFLDEVVSLPAEPNEIAALVESIVNRQARIEDVNKASSEQTGVTGELSQISLPDLIQLFSTNRKSGSIELTRRGADDRDEHGTISMVEGDVVQAAVGVVEGEKALFRLLTWDEGSFAFSHGGGEVPHQIHTPTRNLILEGMRQVDELARLSGDLPEPGSSVALRVKTAELPNTIHPLTQEVLLLLEIYSTVQDVVDRCSFPDYQVLRTLQTLAGRGMIEIRKGAPKTQAVLSEAERLFSSAQAHRLREWLGRLSARGAGTTAKLLVVSADEGATHDFVRLLRGLPGIRLEGSFAGGNFSSDDLAPIGRLAVETDTALELVHVPADSRYAPLWPVAAHGAIGTIFLMAGAIGPAAQRVRALAETIRSLPRARMFHVILVRKGERSLADDLRDNTRLFDEVPLFLLPLERDKEPVALLRGLFSRVLP
jgi:CheY-like chemotaxis protein